MKEIIKISVDINNYLERLKEEFTYKVKGYERN